MISEPAAWLVAHPVARIVVTLVVGILILRFTARVVRLVLTILLVGLLAWMIWQSGYVQSILPQFGLPGSA